MSMFSKKTVKKALFRIMKAHEADGTLNEQTPRMLRSELSVQLGASLEDLKEEIKGWISDFFSGASLSSSSEEEPQPPVTNVTKKREREAVKPRKVRNEPKKKRKPVESSSSSSESEFSSSSSDRENDDSGNLDSPSQLRSIAKMVGVPPGFWTNVDRNNFDSIAQKLKEFCDAKGVAKMGDIPTMSEAKKYKAQRETMAELEGINQANIVDSRRRKCRDFIPLF